MRRLIGERSGRARSTIRTFVDWISIRHCTGVLIATVLAITSAHATPQPSEPPPDLQPVKVVVWNRDLVVVRASYLGVDAPGRAQNIKARIEALPIEENAEVTIHQASLGTLTGAVLTANGRHAVTLVSDDVEPESGQTLEQLAEQTATNLRAILKARADEGRWPVILRGVGLTLVATILATVALFVLTRILRRALGSVSGRLGLSGNVRVAGVDVRPFVDAIRKALLRLATFVIGAVVIYLWLTYVLALFPYSQPWSDQLGHYLLDMLADAGQGILHAIPGIFIAIVIFLIARGIVRILKGFFLSVETSRLQVGWLEPETARATRRIVVVLVWAFALTLAYPYIPGSDTSAFKGVSVFIGLMVTLGSAGFVTQLMSGLVVIYSRALRVGEYVQIGDDEGIVTEVGLLSTKFATMRNEELTIPNGLLISRGTKNLSRLKGDKGVPLWTSVTIGYDTPWRQVHALLMTAAANTGGVRKEPAPWVAQSELSDYYVHYTLEVHLEEPKRRRVVLSELNSRIQDSFNAERVQIMSPHYRARASGPVLGPPDPASGPITVEVRE